MYPSPSVRFPMMILSCSVPVLEILTQIRKFHSNRFTMCVGFYIYIFL